MGNPDPEWDIDATVRVSDIEDEVLSHDIETEVLHMQGLMKYRAQLDTWRAKYNVEY